MKRDVHSRIMIFGTGRFSQDTCLSLCSSPGPEKQITVAGRAHSKPPFIADCIGTTADPRQTGFQFKETEYDPDDLRALIEEQRPSIILICASEQSPYEAESAPSGWTELLKHHGLALSLPFQLSPAVKIAAAAATMKPRPILLNACLPDWSNSVLHAIGLPVFAGVGNVTGFHRFVCEHEGTGRGPIRILATHAQLLPGHSAGGMPRIWIGDREADPGTYVHAWTRLGRRERNRLAAQSAAALINAMCGRAATSVSVPGPMGLVGGYPVAISGDRISLDLPDGLHLDDATAWNRMAGQADGVLDAGDGTIRFTAAAAQRLRAHLDRFQDGFSGPDLPEVLERWHGLRRTLRAAKAPTPSAEQWTQRRKP
jgi:hypothetical protein